MIFWLGCILILSELAARPSTSAPTSSSRMDEDIPPELFDQIAAEEASRTSTAARPTPGSNRGVRICPHCTFENEHGGTDCEVCGLPLS
jgi:nuclear protein localization family protein 4